jgi:hypothetical protein
MLNPFGYENPNYSSDSRMNIYGNQKLKIGQAQVCLLVLL